MDHLEREIARRAIEAYLEYRARGLHPRKAADEAEREALLEPRRLRRFYPLRRHEEVV